MNERPGRDMIEAERSEAMLDLFLDSVSAWISAELDAHEIPSVLLKGRTFGRLFYENEFERPFGDTDVLVPAADVAVAERLLQEAGFVRTDRDEDWLGPGPKYAHTFYRISDGAEVDLHWHLSGAACSSHQVWEALREHTVPTALGGRVVSVLDPAASAMLVATHSAHHGTKRPRTLADVEGAVTRLELAVWRDAVSLAGELGASEAFAAGLRLTPSGDALADKLGLVQPRSAEMWLKTHPSTYGAEVLDRITQATSLRVRLRLIRHVAFPPQVVMYRFSPLARRGRVGLALAYVLRPLRLTAHAAPAMRDWLKAHHASRG